MCGKCAEASVVVVGSRPDDRALVVEALGGMGWTTHVAATAAEGLALVTRERPEVVVLDHDLPDVAGVEACRRLRRLPQNRHLGIILVTGDAGEDARLLGFEAGADDCVPRPFSARELAMRVRAVSLARCAQVIQISHSRARSPRAPFRWRGLELDPIKHRVHADGAELFLRPAEFKILLLLLSTPGRTFSRPEIQSVVEHDGRARNIDTHVSRLREALGPYAAAIATVPGEGYRLADESMLTPACRPARGSS
jgi:two-component system phosphate regulon response regulator PhoB